MTNKGAIFYEELSFSDFKIFKLALDFIYDFHDILYNIYVTLFKSERKISILVYFIFALSALPSIIFLFYRHTIEAAAKLEDPPLNIDKYLNNKNSNF